MKYHMTDAGPKPCRATKRPCKYGSHYEDKNSADKAFAKTFDKTKNNPLKGTKKVNTQKSNTQKSAEFKNIQNKEQKENTLPLDEATSVDDVSLTELIDAGYIVEAPYDPEYDGYTPDPEYDNTPDPDYVWEEDNSTNTIDPEVAKIIAEENQEEDERNKY